MEKSKLLTGLTDLICIVPIYKDVLEEAIHTIRNQPEIIRCNECMYHTEDNDCELFHESGLHFEKSFCAWALEKDEGVPC